MPIETPQGTLDVENAKLRASEIIATASVGIGTTDSNQAYPLQIFKETGPDIRIQEGATSSSAARLYSNNSNLYIQTGTNFTTGSSGDIAFQTMGGQATHMIVKSDGKVGVGTTDPQYRLDVGYGGGDVMLRVMNTHTSTGKLIFGRSGNTDIRSHAIECTNSGGAENNVMKFLVHDGSAVVPHETRTEVMTLLGNGNVGIGTASPDEKLDIKSGNIKLSEANSYGTDRYIYTHWEDGLNDHQIGMEFDYYTGSGGTSTTHSRINFISNANLNEAINGSGKQTTMSILSNGKVGIGTNDPEYKLHIEDGTAPTILLENTDTILTENQDVASILFKQNDISGGGTGIIGKIRIVSVKRPNVGNYYGQGGNMVFSVGDSANDNANVDALVIRGNGYVGIGTTNPDYPLTINQTTNKSIDGGNYTPFIRMTRNNGHNWTMASSATDSWNGNLYWFANTDDTGNPIKRVIVFENDQSKGTVVNVNTFTGQHRNMIKGIPHTQIINFIGLIVSANNNKYLKLNGEVVNNSDAITINEAVPIVELSTVQYDKKCFGVISGSEDPESRTDTYGRVTSIFTREQGDVRTFVNSLGEGAIWVTNINGPLESGDYITTSNVAGYGMKQDSEFLANYTVAKITMDCDFNPPTQPKQQIVKELSSVNYYINTSNTTINENEYSQLNDEQKEEYTLEVREELVNVLDEHGQLQWEDHPTETEKAYKIRYLTADGTETDEANAVHIAAFVGCTYHCG